MGKDITDKKDKKERKEKKEKKEKRASLDGVTKVKKEKKEKKSRKSDVADALEAELEQDATMMDVDETMVTVDGEEVEITTGALVPFANPLAEDAKEVKRILKCVKKCEFTFIFPIGLFFWVLVQGSLLLETAEKAKPEPKHQMERNSLHAYANLSPQPRKQKPSVVV